MMKQILFMMAAILFAHSLYAQNEANVWYFGEYAGIDFSTGSPVAISGSKLSTDEGCATICNNVGELLFYTDGSRIWNRSHATMQNGNNLRGHSSSTQSGVIVPMPGDDDKYYVFTVGARQEESNEDFCYSIVDMSLDGGLGAVIEKNIKLFSPSVEKITALRHRSCENIWVIGHEWDNNCFLAFLITPDGVESDPVRYCIGTEHERELASDGTYTLNKRGYLKASPDGKKLALAICGKGLVEVFDFDNETGEVSNPISLPGPGGYESYGVEFSPDGTKLYTNLFDSEFRYTRYDMNVLLYQYDLSSGDEDEINDSRVTIFNKDYEDDFFRTWKNTLGAMQIGPDMKIYVARMNTYYLGTILYPNKKGVECDFRLEGVNLGNNRSMWGLPTFIQSYFYETTDVWAPDLLAEIGNNEYKIPIYAKLGCGTYSDLELEFNAEIRIDAFFFEPHGLTTGTITDTRFEGRDLIIHINVPNAKVSNDSAVITEIIGTVLLADTNYTDITIDNFDWENSQVDHETFDGSMRIYGDCLPEGRGITYLEETKINISPNPVNDYINVLVETGEQGLFELKLYNLQGSEVLAKQYKISGIGSDTPIELKMDAGNLPSGMYNLVVKTASSFQSIPVSIVK